MRHSRPLWACLNPRLLHRNERACFKSLSNFAGIYHGIFKYSKCFLLLYQEPFYRWGLFLAKFKTNFKIEITSCLAGKFHHLLSKYWIFKDYFIDFTQHYFQFISNFNIFKDSNSSQFIYSLLIKTMNWDSVKILAI